jgi:hypothetical protein
MAQPWKAVFSATEAGVHTIDVTGRILLVPESVLLATMSRRPINIPTSCWSRRRGPLYVAG